MAMRAKVSETNLSAGKVEGQLETSHIVRGNVRLREHMGLWGSWLSLMDGRVYQPLTPQYFSIGDDTTCPHNVLGMDI